MYNNLQEIESNKIFGEFYTKFKTLLRANLNIILYGNRFKKLLVFNTLRDMYSSALKTTHEHVKITYNSKIYEDSLNYFEHKSYVILNCRSLRTNPKVLLLYLFKKFGGNYNISDDLKIYKKIIVLYNFEVLSFNTQDLFKSLGKYNIQIILTVKSINYILPQISSRYQNLLMLKVSSPKLDYLICSNMYEQHIKKQLGCIFDFFNDKCSIVDMRNIFYNLLANSISTKEIILQYYNILSAMYPHQVHFLCETCAHYEHLACHTNKEILILECFMYKLKEKLI